MLFFGLIFATFAATFSNAQIAYNRMSPYDPQYLLRTLPVRRSLPVATEYQRLQYPISQYFPQVDTQVVPQTYVAQKPVAYRLPNGQLYVIPPTFSDDEAQVVRNDEDNDYDTTYDEYDNEYGPVFARPLSSYTPGEVYGTPQEEEVEPQDEQYNDMVVNYLLGDEIVPPMNLRIDANFHNMERKKHEMALPTEKEVGNKRGNDVPDTTASTTTAALTIQEQKMPSTSQAGSTETPTALPPSALPPKLAAPLARIHKSGEGIPNGAQIQHGIWQNFDVNQRGQKEFPLYRPFQVSNQHREAMETLQHELSRAKNSINTKDALPMIEKMMAAQRSKDPLAEQLNNLKFRNM